MAGYELSIRTTNKFLDVCELLQGIMEATELDPYTARVDFLGATKGAYEVMLDHKFMPIVLHVRQMQVSDAEIQLVAKYFELAGCRVYDGISRINGLISNKYANEAFTSYDNGSGLSKSSSEIVRLMQAELRKDLENYQAKLRISVQP